MENPSPEWLRSVGGAFERGLPLVAAPFAAAARDLAAREADVLEAAEALSSGGFLRHLGAFVDFRPLGLRGYLFGLQAAGDVCAELAEELARLDYVTHIYTRRASPNLWFTAIMPGDEAALALSGGLKYPHAALAAVRRIKLEPAFAREGASPGAVPLPPFQKDDCVVLSPLQRTVLRLAQADFPLMSRPFARIGARAGISEDEVLACLRELNSLGVLRRVGASLHHVRAGYSSNSLIAWDFSGETEDAALDAASRAAGSGWLSHCYLRRVLADTLDSGWRCNLFTMIHARSDGELRGREDFLAAAMPGRAFVSMRTEREWKKTPYRI